MHGTPISKDLGTLLNVELWRDGQLAHGVVVYRLTLLPDGARLLSATGREYELARMSSALPSAGDRPSGWYLYDFGADGMTPRLYVGDTLTVTPGLPLQLPEPPPPRLRLVAARRPRRLTDLGLSYEAGMSPREYNARVAERYRALPWWRRALITVNLLRGRT